MHVYMYEHTHTNLCLCLNTYIHEYSYNTHTHTHTHIYAPNTIHRYRHSHAHIRTQTYTHTHIYKLFLRVYIFIYLYIFSYLCSYHIYIYIYKQTERALFTHYFIYQLANYIPLLAPSTITPPLYALWRGRLLVVVEGNFTPPPSNVEEWLTVFLANVKDVFRRATRWTLYYRLGLPHVISDGDRFLRQDNRWCVRRTGDRAAESKSENELGALVSNSGKSY